MKLGKKKRLSLVQELTTGHTKFSHTHTNAFYPHTAFLNTNCVANGWMQDALHTGTFTHRLFHTQRLLHEDSLTERDMYAQKMWPHTHTADTTHTNTQRHWKTKVFCRQRHFKFKCFAQKNQPVLLFSCFPRRYAFTRRQTKLFSHTKAFTRTGFHTNPVSPIFLAHREEFVHENVCLGPTLLHATAFPHRRFFAWTHSMLLLDEMLRSSDLVLNPSATILVLKKRKPLLAIKILETLTVTYRTPGCLFGCLLGLQKLLLFLHFHPTSGPPHMPWNFFCVLWGWVSAVFFCGVQLSDWVTYIFFLTNFDFRVGSIQWQDSQQKFTDLHFLF